MFSPPVKARSWQGSGQKSDPATPSRCQNCRDGATRLAHVAPLHKLERCLLGEEENQWETLGSL